MQQVIIEIDQQGKAQVSVNGVCGPQCKDLTRELENALGKTVNDQSTADMHRAGQMQSQKAANHA